MKGGWIGVDLDGTLAHYAGWDGSGNIGAPVTAMLERVKTWLSEGRTVKIFTARVGPLGPGSGEQFVAHQHVLIKEWCKLHIGQELEVTCTKDFGMVELWDDRAVRVEINTGRVI